MSRGNRYAIPDSRTSLPAPSPLSSYLTKLILFSEDQSPLGAQDEMMEIHPPHAIHSVKDFLLHKRIPLAHRAENMGRWNQSPANARNYDYRLRPSLAGQSYLQLAILAYGCVPVRLRIGCARPTSETYPHRLRDLCCDSDLPLSPFHHRPSCRRNNVRRRRD